MASQCKAHDFPVNEIKIKKMLTWDLAKLKNYIQALIEKVPQVIVQSRCGEPKTLNAVNKSCERELYEITIEDNPEIHMKTEEVCKKINPLTQFSLCVEILLKTSDGDTLLLELWNLKLVHSEDFWDVRYKTYRGSEAVFNHLMRLLKSIISVSRVVPAYKLSLKQSSDSYVMLYRIYQEELQVERLGNIPHVHKIGLVFTPIGTITMSLAFRSKEEMTIPPKRNLIMVDSDYFNADMTSDKSNRMRRNKNQNILNCQNIGAFAHCRTLPDGVFPELAELEKPFLNLSRGRSDSGENKNMNTSNDSKDINFNSLDDTWDVNIEVWADNVKDSKKMSNSDLSNSSDFVFVDMKPPFACSDTNDLGVFFHDCQHAPQLSSFTSEPKLEDLASQLEKFELSMTDFDNFVDSVCSVESQT